MSPDRTFYRVLVLLGLVITPVTSRSETPPRWPDRESQAAWSIQELGSLLGRHRHRKVAFQEIHVSALLTEPLRLKGTLTFTAPSRLEKHVTSPYEELYLVNENEVSFESPETGVSRALSLEDFPSLRGFVEALRAAFTGNLSTLERFFHLFLDGDRDKWRLRLEPLHEITRNAINSIQITGQQDRLRAMEIWESSGDYSRIEITPDPE